MSSGESEFEIVSPEEVRRILNLCAVYLVSVLLFYCKSTNVYGGWNVMRLAMRDLLPEKILWRKDKIGFLTPVEIWIKHKDSPVLLLMKQYGLNKYDPYFAWKFYVGSTVIH